MLASFYKCENLQLLGDHVYHRLDEEHLFCLYRVPEQFEHEIAIFGDVDRKVSKLFQFQVFSSSLQEMF